MTVPVSTIARAIYHQDAFLDHPAFSSRCVLVTATVCATLGIVFSSGGIVLHMLGGQLKAVGCFCYGVGGTFFIPSVFYICCSYFQAKQELVQVKAIKPLVDIFGNVARFPIIPTDKEAFHAGLFRGKFKNNVPFIYIGILTESTPKVIWLTPIKGEWTFVDKDKMYQLKQLGYQEKWFLKQLTLNRQASIESTPYRNRTIQLYSH